MKVKCISIAVFSLIFLMLGFLLFFSHRQDLFSSRKVKEYNEGWEYSFGEQTGIISLPSVLDVPENTILVLENTIPYEIDNNSAFAFRSTMQSVKVYVDEILIYQYPDRKLIGDTVPSAWNFVKLSEEHAGHRVRICLSSSYDRFSGNIGSVCLGNYNDLVSEVITQQTKIFRISLMVGIVGLAILILPLFGHTKTVCNWQCNLGILLVIVSLWLCGESRMPSGRIGLEVWHYMALISLLFCPVFLTAYLYARWKEILGNITKLLFYVCLIAALSGALSELLGGPDLVQIIPVMQFMVGMTLTYAVLIYFLAARKKDAENMRSELFCIMLIFLAGVVEIIRFYKIDQAFTIYIRMAILLYALNLLRISVFTLMRKVKENQELERQLRRSRAELMASQIRPHFIYNTLNSIRALIKLDPEMARKMVYDFTTYLRSNLDNVGDRELIPFADELNHIQAYLNIEKIRFEERLNIVMDIQVKTFLVPPLSIQPLVENAVKHGLCKKLSGGTVTIRSYEEEDRYVVQVIDDGVGFDVSLLNSNEQNRDISGHVGLENIRFRVREMGGGVLFVTSTPGGGTKVTVQFKKQDKKDTI